MLDVIEMELINSQPKNYQQENWLLDPDFYWEKVSRVDWNYLDNVVDVGYPLWVNGYSSNYVLNDRIPNNIANSLKNSLKLIKLPELQLNVWRYSYQNNSRTRLQGRFSYEGSDYRLWVTDPEYEERYIKQGEGTYSIGECFLTISLGSGPMDHAYKLIAAIIEPEE